MHSVAGNERPNINFPRQASNGRSSAIIFKVVTAVDNFIRTIALWPGDRVIDFFTDETPIRFDLRRIFVGIIQDAEHHDGGLPLEIPLPRISPGIDSEIYANGLIAEQSDVRSRRRDVEAVAALPVKENVGVLNHANYLIADAMDTSERIQILYEIARIPVNERDAIVALALQVINEEMNGISRRRIIRALVAIPPSEREEVVRNAVLLIRPEMEASERIEMILAVAGAPVNERDITVTLVLQVVDEEMDGFSKKLVVRAVAGIRRLERKKVVENAVLLIRPEMDVEARIHMIRIVLAVSVNERDSVIALALQIITQDMDRFSRLVIVDAVSRVVARERVNVIEHVLQLINPQMVAHDRAMIIRAVVNLRVDQRANYVRQRILEQQVNLPRNAHVTVERSLDVHEGDRDEKVEVAIKLLRRSQEKITIRKINRGVEEFIKYLNGRSMEEEYKKLAWRALIAPKDLDETFGPLIGGSDFSILGLLISGEEIIGRLWVFASELREPDQTNAKESMISALKDSYLEGSRVCNQGKTQRLIVGVLQGRLAGVNIELMPEMKVPAPQAMQMFFSTQAHRDIDRLLPLLHAANRFCDANSLVDRERFVFHIRNYAQAQGIAE